MQVTFRDLGLSEPILANIEKAGWQTPTAIQKTAVPKLLADTDCVATANTGSGKTAAFVIPLLEGLKRKRKWVVDKRVRALILCPVRELAQQTAKTIEQLAEGLNLRVLCSVGGSRLAPQITALQSGIDIWVSTPGRALDLLKQESAKLDQLEWFVLDEADQLLDMGFRKEIFHIAKFLPQEHDVSRWLFTATWREDVEDFASKLLSDPVRLDESAEDIPDVRERFVVLSPSRMPTFLRDLIVDNQLDRVLVFASTRVRADRVLDDLLKDGFEAAVLHSDRTQAQRTKALEDFREGKLRVLVATDVASRGIDIAELPCVVNYDLPKDVETYVHRIGRTSRAARCGQAVTFVQPSLAEELPRFAEFLGTEIVPENPYNIVIRTKAEFDREYHEARRRRQEERRSRQAAKKEAGEGAEAAVPTAEESAATVVEAVATEPATSERTQENRPARNRHPSQTRRKTGGKQRPNRAESDAGDAEGAAAKSGKKPEKKAEKKQDRKPEKKFDKKPKKTRKSEIDYDDDNFGNSIHYQPRHRSLRNLGYDQPIHWEPVDPYHPSSQALSLPQIMPDEYPRNNYRNGNRAPRNDGYGKRRFGGNKSGNRR